MKKFAKVPSLNREIIVITLIFFLLSHPLYSIQPESKSESRKALEKSLIFPGWGQIYEKQYFKGILFMTAESFCILQFILKNNQANRVYEKYQLAETSSEAIFYRQETVRYDRARNGYILAGLLVWVANLIDIYIFTKKKYKKGVSFFLKHDEGNKISFGFKLAF